MLRHPFARALSAFMYKVRRQAQGLLVLFEFKDILTYPLYACLYVVSLGYQQGHNPNYDVFDLRPGLWIHPMIKPRGYHEFSFYDYVVAPEYQNTVTKMLGYSRGCPAARKCDSTAAQEDAEGKTGEARRSIACSLANLCHGKKTL
jgi:hypothetical protein